MTLNRPYEKLGIGAAAGAATLWGKGRSVQHGVKMLQQVIKAWEAWYGELGDAVYDPGNPFYPAAKRCRAVVL